MFYLSMYVKNSSIFDGQKQIKKTKKEVFGRNNKVYICWHILHFSSKIRRSINDIMKNF